MKNCNKCTCKYLSENVLYIYIGLEQVNTDTFLRRIATHISGYLCIEHFVTYLNRRIRYLDQAQVKELEKILNDRDKMNKLLEWLLKLKGTRAPVLRDVILSLMDSCEDSDGGQTLFNHWSLVQIVLNIGIFM